MNSKQPLTNNNKRPKWNQELQQPFIENIDTSALETEMLSITNMTHIANITQNQMDSLSDLLSQTVINSADTTFQNLNTKLNLQIMHLKITNGLAQIAQKLERCTIKQKQNIINIQPSITKQCYKCQ